MVSSPFPLPFEQVRWRTRRCAVSDFRFVVFSHAVVAREMALHDVSLVEVEPSLLQRLTGVGTLVVHSARPGDDAVRLPRLWNARRAAVILELCIADARGIPPADSPSHPLLSSVWRVPRAFRPQVTLLAPAVVLLALVGVGIGLSGHSVPVWYAADDSVRPRGVRRSDAEITAFMEREVLPWARHALAPVVRGRDVTCETCHGPDPEARRWTMPAVRALPEPAVRQMADAGSDAQMRNALHGYLAEEDNQAVAGYMRGVVMPGMARLLHRPAYDFAQTYEYNRSRAAFGCYHCHMVGEP